MWPLKWVLWGGFTSKTTECLKEGRAYCTERGGNSNAFRVQAGRTVREGEPPGECVFI